MRDVVAMLHLVRDVLCLSRESWKWVVPELVVNVLLPYLIAHLWAYSVRSDVVLHTSRLDKHVNTCQLLVTHETTPSTAVLFGVQLYSPL